MRITILLLLASLARAEVAPKPDFVPAGYKLVFSDEFEGAKVDTAKWNYRTGLRFWSIQKPENVSVSNGTMKLHLKKEKTEKAEYTAGGLISKSEFKYGFYQCRFKVPAGKGWHTSFWMMANTAKSSGTDAEMTRGARQELDVCEQDSIDPNAYSVNVHQWAPTHKSFGHKRIKTEADLSKDFHIWSCEFDAKEVKYYFDGKLVQTVDVSNFEHGGMSVWLTSIASPLGKTDKVDDSKLPETAEFDWVRVYVKEK